MKLRIKQADIILTGYFRLGPNLDQLKINDRGWFIYPDPGKDLIPVVIVRAKTTPSP